MISGEGRVRRMASPGLRTQRVLIVEDQMLVALDLEEILRRLGYVPVGPVGNLRQAVKMAATEALDAALLDYDLHGRSSEPVSEILARRGIPFAISSAYTK